MRWRRKPGLSGVYLRGEAPGRPTCTLAIEVVENFTRREYERAGRREGSAPLWDLFWPPPEPPDSGATYTLGYDESGRR